MAKNSVKYCVVDAFTDTAFKGNPAVVCMLLEKKEEEWLQSVASEFNLSETCYLTPIVDSELKNENPTFQLRWFTPVAEVNLCGHATLAAAQYLFAYGLVDSDKIEFRTLSGVLIAKKVPDNEISSAMQNGVVPQGFSIELDFPAVPITEFNSAEVSAISKSLNGASVVEIHKTTKDDLFVMLTSGREVVEVQPQIDEVVKLPGSGMIITGAGPPGTEFDFCSRFFCPKLGIDEVRVTHGFTFKRLEIASGSCLWKRTLCISALLEEKAGETRLLMRHLQEVVLLSSISMRKIKECF